MKSSLTYFYLVLLILSSAGCGSPTQPGSENGSATSVNTDSSKMKNDTVFMSMGINSKGIGRFQNIQLSEKLDEALATQGGAIYNAKCFACHKLTNEKLVGPGWKGVTLRRKPEWIMNFVTNTNVMLDKDLVAQAVMVTCLIRMPVQDLTDDQARQVLEFMRKNDSKN